jgi:5-formyltetrahydrofolate cyclo-ligase
MSNPASTKTQLREQLRRERILLGEDQRAVAALAVARNAAGLPLWGRSRRVAIYLAADGEVGTEPLQANCLQEGKSIYLPAIRNDLGLDFALWAEGEPLVTNRFGIPEPGPGAPRLAAGELDIIFMPLVGWDRAGRRLGMGGGFYDRTLAGVEGPLKVGLAYDRQRVERIPAEPWDISLEFVATETSLNRCSGEVGDATP